MGAKDALSTLGSLTLIAGMALVLKPSWRHAVLEKLLSGQVNVEASAGMDETTVGTTPEWEEYARAWKERAGMQTKRRLLENVNRTLPENAGSMFRQVVCWATEAADLEHQLVGRWFQLDQYGEPMKGGSWVFYPDNRCQEVIVVSGREYSYPGVFYVSKVEDHTDLWIKHEHGTDYKKWIRIKLVGNTLSMDEPLGYKGNYRRE